MTQEILSLAIYEPLPSQETGGVLISRTTKDTKLHEGRILMVSFVLLSVLRG